MLSIKKTHKILSVAVVITGIILSPVFLIASDMLVVKKATKKFLLTGYTRNFQSQLISPEISGKVVSVNYDIGDKIGATPFIEIDPTFINYQIKRTAESVKGLAVTIRKAESKVSYFEKESRRIKQLHTEDMATESRRDAVLQNLDQAMLELELSSKEMAVLKTQLDELKERRNRHKIFAPPGWIVTERTVEENENVQPAMSLARVADYRKLVVPLSVSNDELSAIQSLPAVFMSDLEEIPVETSIHWINPEFNEKTRKLTIELLIRNYRGEKRGGLKLRLPVKVKTEGLHIPKAAVSIRYENPTVILKNTGAIVHVLVLGDEGDHYLVAEDSRLVPGTELLTADAPFSNGDK